MRCVCAVLSAAFSLRPFPPPPSQDVLPTSLPPPPDLPLPPLQCSEGTYNPTPGLNATRCYNYPLGSWSNVTGASSATAYEQCPLGFFNPSPQLGATNGTCIEMSCPAGAYFIPLALYADDCGYCAPGSASNVTNATSSATCAACPPGSAAAEDGSTSCTSCSPGTAAPAGAQYCAACPGDSYSAGSGASACTPCPDFTVSATVGATSPTQCVANSTIGCPPGSSPGPSSSCSPVSDGRGQPAAAGSTLGSPAPALASRTFPILHHPPPKSLSAAPGRMLPVRARSSARPAVRGSGPMSLAPAALRHACHLLVQRARIGPMRCVGALHGHTLL